MNKILILGSNGMLGHVCVNYMRDRSKVTTTYHKSLYHHFGGVDYYGIFTDSIGQFKSIKDLITTVQPDYIINCIGLIKQNDIDNFQYNSMLVNTLLPQFIAKNGFNSKIIHITTDCVYDGVKGNYDENDEVSATDVYGITKYCGQVNHKNVLNVRLSIIGPQLSGHRGLLDFILLNKEEQITGFKNHFWNGVTTLEFAQWCYDMIVKDEFDKYRTSGPTTHLVLHQDITKGDLLKIINEQFNLEKTIILKDSKDTIDRTLRSNIMLPKKDYKQSLKQLKEYMIDNNEVYKEDYEKHLQR